MSKKQPVLFLSHGSPLTALGGDELAEVWKNLASRLKKPSAILIASAHWGTSRPRFTDVDLLETIHDFGGFPDELYDIQYPATGAEDLVPRIKRLFKGAGWEYEVETKRGLDHGAWVPLRSLFPKAEIPVIALSMQPCKDALHHYNLGKILSPLSAENVLIIASGHMTHNLMDFMSQHGKLPTTASIDFRNWVHERIMTGNDTELMEWLIKAPGLKLAHPTSEHFLPLFIALGAALGYKRAW